MSTARAVIVVDMLRGFLEEGRVLDCGPSARAIVPAVVRLLENATGRGDRVVFLVDTHDPDDGEFAMFPPHCVRGTEECEVVPELRRFTDGAAVIEKRRYSGFFETDLAELLARWKSRELVVCGVCTDICVMHTVADARNRDYPVFVPQDAVATFDQDNHGFALGHMEKVLGATLASVDRL